MDVSVQQFFLSSPHYLILFNVRRKHVKKERKTNYCTAFCNGHITFRWYNAHRMPACESANHLNKKKHIHKRIPILLLAQQMYMFKGKKTCSKLTRCSLSTNVHSCHAPKESEWNIHTHKKNGTQCH